MIRLAPEGTPQMIACTVVLGAAIWLASLYFWPAAIALLAVWGWSIAFFRDPKREAVFDTDTLCSPADGTVADITPIEFDGIDGPAVRVGIFLSLFNVHINRAPCHGTVRSTRYCKGKFLPAMKPEAADQNESNTLLIDTPAPMPGPIGVRQITGLAARRIICHARKGTELATGQRFGLIKFGSRTELIVPQIEGTVILVSIGDKVRAGITPLIRQPLYSQGEPHDDRRSQDPERASAKAAPTPS